MVTRSAPTRCGGLPFPDEPYLIGSYGICLDRCGLITCVVEIMTRLYPSGADLAMSVVPMVEPAPGLFSMTIGWPMAGASSFCRMRAATSVNPPGPKGTMILIGRVGYGCACAAVARRRAQSARIF